MESIEFKVENLRTWKRDRFQRYKNSRGWREFFDALLSRNMQLLISRRFIRVTWTTRAIRITHGWKQLHTTSTMKLALPWRHSRCMPVWDGGVSCAPSLPYSPLPHPLKSPSHCPSSISNRRRCRRSPLDGSLGWVAALWFAFRFSPAGCFAPQCSLVMQERCCSFYTFPYPISSS